MTEEFDFAELRNYLQGQMDMDAVDVVLDEPWRLERRPSSGLSPNATPPRFAHVPPAASKANVIPDVGFQSRPVLQQSAAIPNGNKPAAPVENVPSAMPLPAARPVVKRGSAPYEKSESLESFYELIQKEAVYAGASKIFSYEGPEHPQLLMLMNMPDSKITGRFIESPVGEMLCRLFGSLGISADSVGVTYFNKSLIARPSTPLVENSLRKMLASELSFIAPKVMVTFGEPVFHGVFGRGKNFGELAGTDLEFSGIRTCALLDAFAMAQDKQLKWVTWKVHIPKCSYFKS